MTLTFQYDQTIVLDTGSLEYVLAVTFHPDGKHLLTGNDDGIRRWKLADGQEVGKQTRVRVRAICVSRDQKWTVCGSYNGASVWDGDVDEKIIDMEHGNAAWAVDVSPDSASFATGTGGPGNEASMWSIKTGERVVGPLHHDNAVVGIKFSPSGKHIATACMGGSICIFDSENGDKLITIKTTTPTSDSFCATTPLAWSSDGQHIFAAAKDNKVRSFDVSTGSQVAESQILRDRNDDYDVYSIALAANGKFIATFADRSISLLDVSTLARICPVIQGGERIWSIAISTDNSCLATGQVYGKIILYRLNGILPDSYGPFHVSVCSFVATLCHTSPILAAMSTNCIGIRS